MSHGSKGHGGRGEPCPDPTKATTRAIATAMTQREREVELLRTMIEEKIVALALRLDREIALLGDLRDEKQRESALSLQAHIDRSSEQFHAVDLLFRERDIRFAQEKHSSELAIAKSETATQKQLDAVSTLVSSNLSALADKLGLMTQRLDKMDGRSSGLNAGWGILLGAMGFVATGASIIAFLKR